MENEERYFHEASFTDREGHQRTLRVPVVQELARQGLKGHLPERFVRVDVEPQQEHTRIPISEPYCSIDQHVSNTVPVINVAKLRGVEGEGRSRAQELGKLGEAAREWGLFVVVEHGLSLRVLHGVKEIVKGFFELSFEEKKRSVGSYMNVDNMGYGRNFVKSVDQPLDWIDRLSMKAAPKGGDEGLNVWPSTPPNFRQVMEEYVVEARKLLDDLLQALAEALSLERNAFLKHFDPDESEINVRVNYYPPCPRPDLTLGLTPHTDGSVLTLLMQFGATGGLQILKHQKIWLTLPWPHDALLVNAGDFLEIMSNGRVRSPWHRVVTQMDAERFSVALFYYPPSRVEIRPEPIEDQAMEDGGFRKVVIGDYLQHFYRISPTKEKQAIIYAKFNEMADDDEFLLSEVIST